MMKESLFIILVSIGIFTTEVKAKEKLHCDHTNYKEYIYDRDKTARLVEQTGEGCQLARADLRGAYLGRAYLRGAYLGGADLGGADLGGADLGGADLRGAYLYEVNLRGAYLYEVNLSEVNLSGADLGGAYLRRADLGGADLRGADLSGVHLYFASLRGANLRKAKYSDQTMFPFFFSRRGKNLVKIHSNDPCVSGELTAWEKFIGIEAGSLFGEGQCGSSTAINDSDRNSRVEKAGENNEQNLDERGSGVRGEVLR